MIRILLVSKNDDIIIGFSKNIASCFTQIDKQNDRNRLKDTTLLQHRLRTPFFLKEKKMDFFKNYANKLQQIKL